LINNIAYQNLGIGRNRKFLKRFLIPDQNLGTGSKRVQDYILEKEENLIDKWFIYELSLFTM